MMLKRPLEVSNRGEEEIVIEPGESVQLDFKMTGAEAEAVLIEEVPGFEDDEE